MKNILYYGDTLDHLVADYADDDDWAELDEDTMFNIRHSVDYESFAFYVIDDKTVITADTLSGDVVAENTVKEFIRQAIEYAQEEN